MKPIIYFLGRLLGPGFRAWYLKWSGHWYWGFAPEVATALRHMIERIDAEWHPTEMFTNVNEEEKTK